MSRCATKIFLVSRFALDALSGKLASDLVVVDRLGTKGLADKRSLSPKGQSEARRKGHTSGLPDRNAICLS